MEVSGQLHAPATLPQGKPTTVSTGYVASWAPGPVLKLWRIAKCWLCRDSKTSRPARHNTDWAVANSLLMNVIPAKWKLCIRTPTKRLQTVSYFTTEEQKSWNPKQFHPLVFQPRIYIGFIKIYFSGVFRWKTFDIFLVPILAQKLDKLYKWMEY
jgi:hypothetical protein